MQQPQCSLVSFDGLSACIPAALRPSTYSGILGTPCEGIHAWRTGYLLGPSDDKCAGWAVVDTALWIIVAIISVIVYIRHNPNSAKTNRDVFGMTLYSLAIWFSLGMFCHWLFGVNTAVMKAL